MQKHISEDKIYLPVDLYSIQINFLEFSPELSLRQSYIKCEQKTQASQPNFLINLIFKKKD